MRDGWELKKELLLRLIKYTVCYLFPANNLKKKKKTQSVLWQQNYLVSGLEYGCVPDNDNC